MFIGRLLSRALRLPSAADYTAMLLETSEVSTALDVGCGVKSPLTAFRPRIRTVGVDAHPPAVEAARLANVHDAYVTADILKDGLEAAVAANCGENFDLVTLYDVIEHLPKRRGCEIVELCEQISNKYILIQTPNGFVEQGPEYGNEFQRHRSGWFPQDLVGLGYTVYGTTGTKYLVGYAGSHKSTVRGFVSLDVLLSGLLHARTNVKHAFNLVAIKDVRGVLARLGKKMN
jgi:2-polyprenyl-3-methyl-5-hydroxy-6-metoxy-1,4-benzoquinol methylase